MKDGDELYVRESVTSLTVVEGTPKGGGGESPHDPGRALAVVRSLTTVDEVLECLPDQEMAEANPQQRSDLDYVHVGCWGGVIHVVDPGLASDFLHMPMSEEVANQEARWPGARVIGEVYLNMGGEYAETIVSLPGVPRLIVREWDDGTEATGELHRTLDALGMTVADVGEFFDPETFEDWENEAVVARALSGFDLDPETAPDRDWSVFRVSRPEGVRFAMEEVWFGM